MSLVPIPMTLNDIGLHLSGSIRAPDYHRHIHTLVRHIRNIERIRNRDFRLLRLINDVPVRVIGIIPELQGHLVVVAALRIEIRTYILTEHETVDNRALGTVVRCAVHIITLHLDICSVRLLVLVPCRIARMIIVFLSCSLVILEEIEGLGRLRMTSIILIHRISLGDIRPVLLVVRSRVRKHLTLMYQRIRRSRNILLPEITSLRNIQNLHRLQINIDIVLQLRRIISHRHLRNSTPHPCVKRYFSSPDYKLRGFRRNHCRSIVSEESEHLVVVRRAGLVTYGQPIKGY